ncbi:hypothetical protein QJS04_geneDACA018462 [Acorus gramineus]|uniref:Peptidase metallopeptidase domain-containing protein n=1 Tax=Acorus gramineus TaxID=55184 RepID=A0AAV9ABY6_ACOGR|nr:hypothetical protein QJS04_geneDACA018462 [Acorus gramineus]
MVANSETPSPQPMPLLLVFIILCSPPSTSAIRFLRHESTVEITPKAPTWADFDRFSGAEKGTRVPGMSDLKNYFSRFGYLPSFNASSTNLTDIFDLRLQSAVSLYQTKLGLPVTGKLDPLTLSSIQTPRCGLPDSSSALDRRPFHLTKHYAFFNGQPRWDRPSPTTLTYAFSPADMVEYLSMNDIRAVFRRAFNRWAAAIPVEFSETNDYASADIKIGFYGGDHGDGEPFDGVLGVLAHAFSPESGKLHLDTAETWAVDFGNQNSRVAVDLESVATHEIGHVLGLAHSSVKEAIMYPSLSPRTKKVDLRLDDVEGVQALYGSNPNFRFSSIESDTSPSTTSDAPGFDARGAVRASCAGVLLAVLALL